MGCSLFTVASAGRPALLVVIGLWLTAVLSPGASFAEERPALLYVVRALTQQVSGTCSLSFEPDRAIIVGGVRAEGVKAGTVDRKLTEQIAEIEELAGRLGATVRAKDRIRTVRNPGESPAVAEQKPFVAIQRVEIELPVGVDVDKALDQFLLLGVDRFGADLSSRSSVPQTAVQYSRHDLAEYLEGLHQACRLEVLDRWCESQVPAGIVAGCKEVLGSLEPHFTTRSFSVTSEPVLLATGRTNRLSVSRPFSASRLAQFELAGSGTVELEGTLAMQVQLP